MYSNIPCFIGFVCLYLIFGLTTICQTVPISSASRTHHDDRITCSTTTKEELRRIANSIPDFIPPSRPTIPKECGCIFRRSRNLAITDCATHSNLINKSCRLLTVPAGSIRTKYGYNLQARFSCCTGALLQNHPNREDRYNKHRKE